VIGSGVGVGVGVDVDVDVDVDVAPSCTQVAFSPGCVHIVFPHSCSAVLSNPLTDPLCLHFWMVTVLPSLLSSCPRFF
jgi:hypothetical protein